MMEDPFDCLCPACLCALGKTYTKWYIEPTPNSLMSWNNKDQLVFNKTMPEILEMAGLKEV
jgi:hypothetical protein